MEILQVALSSLVMVILVHISVFYVVKFLYPANDVPMVVQEEPTILPEPSIPEVSLPTQKPINDFDIPRGTGPPPPMVFTKTPVIDQGNASSFQKDMSSQPNNTQSGVDPRPLPGIQPSTDGERRVDLPVA